MKKEPQQLEWLHCTANPSGQRDISQNILRRIGVLLAFLNMVCQYSLETQILLHNYSRKAKDCNAYIQAHVKQYEVIRLLAYGTNLWAHVKQY